MRKTRHRFSWITLVVVAIGAVLPARDWRQPLPAYAATMQQTQSAQDSSCTMYHGSFLDTTAQAMLTRLGVTFYPEDHITAFPDPALGIGAEVTLCKAPVITIIDAHSTLTVRSWAPTVTLLADQQRLTLGDQDEVTPSRDSALHNGDTVTIVRVAQTTVEESVVLDYAVQYQDDANLDKGKQEIQRAGKNGLRIDTYTDTRKNGVVTSHVKKASSVQTASVNEVILRGTKIVVLQTGIASWYAGVAPMSAANKTLPFGTVITVTNTSNGKSVTVTVEDRGPYVAGRVIDLSPDAFAKISSLGSGVANVIITAGP